MVIAQRPLDSRFLPPCPLAPLPPCPFDSLARRRTEGISPVNEELIFVTGATGFLGTRLVRELLDRQPHAVLALLIRPGRQSIEERLGDLVPAPERHRVRAYAGDFSQPNLGLDGAAWKELAHQITRVIHSAATVRFDHTLAEARSINVEGTLRVFDLAASVPRLRSLAYVGTAYIAGE
jgi:thioester reductase-like protein